MILLGERRSHARLCLLFPSINGPLVIGSVIVGRLEERDYVFRRDLGLDIVDVVEDIPAPGLEYLHVLLDVLPDLVWCGEGQNMLRIDSPSPECQGVSEPLLKCSWRHVFSAYLEGIEYVNAIVYKIRNEFDA